MKYYPIFLRVAGRPCVVIGGGNVAEQKAESLLAADARVTVISPKVTPTLGARAAEGKLVHQPRRYVHGDLSAFFLAYAATNDAQLHQQIAREAEEAGALLNVVDRPELCQFIVPAIMQRGDLIIATSTSGASPALAKRIRQQLEQAFGPEYALALQLLGRVRERLTNQRLTPDERLRIFAALVESPLLDYVREGQTLELDRLLADTVGDGTSLAGLGLEWD